MFVRNEILGQSIKMNITQISYVTLPQYTCRNPIYQSNTNMYIYIY